jgi:VWFA-related protein
MWSCGASGEIAAVNRFGIPTCWLAPLALLATLAAPAAQAAIELRVQSRPVGDPIRAFVEVTADNGVPVGGLTAADFEARIDASPPESFTFTLPPFEDPEQRISVLFAIDHSTSVQDFFSDAIQAGVSTFIGNMTNGDYAAIVKFNETSGVTLARRFTAIDGGFGNSQLIEALQAPYDGQGTNLLDAIDFAVNEFVATSPPLPDGPKAIVLISDGDDNASTLSQSDVVANAHANGIAIFTVSVGDISGDVAATALMSSLAAETGGRYFAGPDEAEIEAAYDTLAAHLDNSYVLTIPADVLTDCGEHTLTVTAEGQSATIGFIRCDTTPDDFTFVDEMGVDPGEPVVSNSVSITGIDGDTPVPISVTAGEYSIGCGSSFTSEPGVIEFEEEVCVRHTAAAEFNTASDPTVLVVGGVSSSFTSTTRAAVPIGGSGGGGGAGLGALLFGLCVLLGRRLCRA